MYRRIVVPLDGSELAERALPEAEKLAGLSGAPLHLIRVVDVAALHRLAGYGAAIEYAAMVQVLEDEQVAARDYLERMERELAGRGLPVTTELRHGMAARELAAATATGDVVVMATHGRGGMARWFLGSVAEEVARRSPVPVLLVRAAPEVTAPGAGERGVVKEDPMDRQDRHSRTDVEPTHGGSISRRTALRGAGGLAALLAAARVGRIGAHGEGTPAASSAPPVVQAWVDAQNAHDPPAHAALYTPDGVLEDVPNRSAVRGAEIEGFVTGVLRGLGDIRVELRHAFGTDEWAVAEYDFAATNRGLILIPGTEGRRFTLRTVTVFELEGDRIRRSSDYYDVVSILTQLGAMPGPSAPPVATPAP